MKCVWWRGIQSIWWCGTIWHASVLVRSILMMWHQWRGASDDAAMRMIDDVGWQVSTYDSLTALTCTGEPGHLYPLTISTRALVHARVKSVARSHVSIKKKKQHLPMTRGGAYLCNFWWILLQNFSYLISYMLVVLDSNLDSVVMINRTICTPFQKLQTIK